MLNSGSVLCVHSALVPTCVGQNAELTHTNPLLSWEKQLGMVFLQALALCFSRHVGKCRLNTEKPAMAIGQEAWHGIFAGADFVGLRAPATGLWPAICHQLLRGG